jgi:PAS domain S-box-containing protein
MIGTVVAADSYLSSLQQVTTRSHGVTGYQASTPLRYVDPHIASPPVDGVFDLAVVGMVVVARMTHRVHRLNPALEALLGRTESETLGSPLRELVHPDSRDTVTGLLHRSWTGAGPSQPVEVRLMRNNGSDVLVSFTAMSVPAVDKGSGFLLCQAYDIDEQRRVEGDLRTAGHMLETALDATTDAVYMKCARGRYRMLNRAAASYFGCPPGEVVGRLDTEFFSPEDAAALNAVDREVLASGVTTTTEERLGTEHGNRVFQSTKGVYLDDAGQPAGIFGISRDITEQHRADDEHRRFEEALELTVEGVAHLDHQGRFLWVNDAFAGLCGYATSEMIGLPWAVLAHPDELDHITAAHARLSEGVRIEREMRTVRADGSWFYAQLVVVKAKDGDGAPAGFYSTLRDVSDRKIAEEVLHRAGVELERRNSELEAFAGMVAHDLRQPLQVVGGFAQLLSQHDLRPPDERADRYLAAIERGIGTMTAMVESMLEYARAGEAAAPEGLTDSHRVVGDVIDGLQGSMNGGRVIVGDYLPVLPADSAQLGRLFQNLIGNALKFRADTGATVRIAAKRDGDDWRFTVEDDGIGVGPEFVDRLFGMFARERRSDCAGTGMGLAICRRIVEHHGGRIWFEPAPGHGSIFSFTLPAGPAAA